MYNIIVYNIKLTSLPENIKSPFIDHPRSFVKSLKYECDCYFQFMIEPEQQKCKNKKNINLFHDQRIGL